MSVWSGVLDKIKTAVELIASAINPLGGMDVNLQDQTTRPLQLFFSQAKGSPTTIVSNIAVDGTQVTVTDATNFVVGDYMGIFSNVSGERRFYFGTILVKNVNLLTLDTPFDFAFQAGDLAISTTRDLDVNGATGTQTFSIGPFGGATDFRIDITRIIFQIVTDGPPTFNLFGDLAKLTNGLVLRRNNGLIDNIFNVKTNGELANLMYDMIFYDPTHPQAVNGVGGRMTFGGQSKHGVVIRLAVGDTLDILVRDDLRNLLTFRIVAEGHVVD